MDSPSNILLESKRANLKFEVFCSDQILEVGLILCFKWKFISALKRYQTVLLFLLEDIKGKLRK